MINIGQWIEWPGGKCPVDPDTTVDVKLAAYDSPPVLRARDWSWSAYEGRGRITAYRVIGDAP